MQNAGLCWARALIVLIRSSIAWSSLHDCFRAIELKFLLPKSNYRLGFLYLHHLHAVEITLLPFEFVINWLIHLSAF